MKTLSACLLLAAALAATTAARADGFLIVERPHPAPDGHPPFAPLWVKRHHVEVTVRGQVATTVIDQEFENPTGARLEATYIFPVPRGAQIDRFSMEINGKMTEPELLPADKAREIYEGIVRSMRDPALLEYAGRDAFRARVFPIEPRGTKRIRLSYTEVVTQDAGLFTYRYPLNTEKFSSKPIPSVRVRVDLAADAPLGSIWSPSHTVEIERQADRAGAVVSWEAKHARPDTDFELLWQTASQPVAATLLTHREPGGDGWFLLLASPAAWTPGTKATPKDILFVVDTSGSMSGGKLDQARRALAFCVENLGDDDRFDLIRFSSDAEPLFGRLEPNAPETRKRAAKFIDGLKPNGGTAIDAALQAALESVNRGGDERRPRIVVFLTDGLPTVGPRDEKEILKRLAKHPGGARVFTFGVGKDVNTHLLDRLAEESRAFSQYVRPDEDLELKLSSFYGRIRDPMLAGISLEFPANAAVRQLHPAALPDLFKGDQLLVAGRFQGRGNGTLHLRGRIAGEERTFDFPVSFPDHEDRHAFLPRLWATRRIGFLLDEIRLRGDNPELRGEVASLAREYGVVTPYTSWLIVEDEERRSVPQASRTLQEIGRDPGGRRRAEREWEEFGGTKSGAAGVAGSTTQNALKYGLNAQAAMSGARDQFASRYADAAPAEQAAARRLDAAIEQQRFAGGRAFYRNGNQWVDASAQKQSAQTARRIQFGTDAYFQLAAERPEAAPLLALGRNLLFASRDELIEIYE